MAHRHAFPESSGVIAKRVEVRRLDSVLDGVALPREILVKIDVQGYEDRVITGGSNLIGQARAMIVEVSFQRLYEGQPLFDDVYHLLKAYGFAYMGNFYQILNPKEQHP